MSTDNTTRLTVTFSRETDLALRAYLGAQGMRKGDLSKFIEDAVRWRMFDQAVQAVKANNADVDPADLQAAIDEAMAEASRADILVTGDKRDLLALDQHRGTRILTARDALDLVRP